MQKQTNLIKRAVLFLTMAAQFFLCGRAFAQNPVFGRYNTSTTATVASGTYDAAAVSYLVDADGAYTKGIMLTINVDAAGDGTLELFSTSAGSRIILNANGDAGNGTNPGHLFWNGNLILHDTTSNGMYPIIHCNHGGSTITFTGNLTIDGTNNRNVAGDGKWEGTWAHVIYAEKTATIWLNGSTDVSFTTNNNSGRSRSGAIVASSLDAVIHVGRVNASDNLYIHDFVVNAATTAQVYGIETGEGYYDRETGGVIHVNAATVIDGVTANGGDVGIAAGAQTLGGTINFNSDLQIRNVTATGNTYSEAFALTAYEGGTININSEPEMDNTIQIDGDIDVWDAGSTVNLKLTNENSFWRGAAYEVDGGKINLSLSNGGKWIIAKDSSIQGFSLNNGVVAFENTPMSPHFKTLTTGSLLGTSGTIYMNVDLGAAQGDRLVVSEHSEGTHLIVYKNTNSGSDLPDNTSLLVVQTADGGAVFSGTLDQGTYQYETVHGDGSEMSLDESNWYLVRSGTIPTPDPDPQPDLSNTANAAIGTHSALLGMLRNSTLSQRMGELRQERHRPAPVGEDKSLAHGGWAREDFSYARLDDNASRHYIQRAYQTQFGVDWHIPLNDCDVFAGILGEYQRATRSFSPGTGSSDAFGGGFYLIGLHPDGWYADVTAKYLRMENRFDTVTPAGEQTNGRYGVNALHFSMEAGRRFEKIDRHLFFMEPEMQLWFAWIDSARYTASNGLLVSPGAQSELSGRLGVRFGMRFADLGVMEWLEPYMRMDHLQQLDGRTRVGINDNEFSPDMARRTERFGAGASGQIGKRTFFWAELHYSLNNRFASDQWGGNVGVRWEW